MRNLFISIKNINFEKGSVHSIKNIDFKKIHTKFLENKLLPKRCLNNICLLFVFILLLTFRKNYYSLKVLINDYED